jgi:predicted dehydrogenase
MKKYKWGILAPGKMSAKFTRGLKLLENAELWAVGSRSAERSKAFADEFGFRKYYGSYEELAKDPETEIIYIASPHSSHHEHTLLCLENGKNVICEKAFAINHGEVSEMIEKARTRKLFLMEALWPPFQPYYKKANDILASGILGDIRHIYGYFSFIPPYDAADRKFNISLGGGSLLDIGIYPVIDILKFMGIPSEIKAEASFAPSGAEESITSIFKYDEGTMATIYSSFRTNSGIGAILYCEKGNLTISRGRDMNQQVLLRMHDGTSEEFIYSPPAMGYHFEAEEVMRCLDRQQTESTVVPLNFSEDLIKTLDRIRATAGIIYPGHDRN